MAVLVFEDTLHAEMVSYEGFAALTGIEALAEGVQGRALGVNQYIDCKLGACGRDGFVHKPVDQVVANKVAIGDFFAGGVID
jgi:hypothetical protein